ncbi:MAG: hypothetical protein LBQ75_07845 [Zoogloeaceae bacterium]|jgi:hypothetical protein|nr:hypothetical protein [Zoogloeaceae bacterium]
MSKKQDTEMLELLASIERGLQQLLAGEGRVTTGEEIARRARVRRRSAGGKRAVRRFLRGSPQNLTNE